MSDDNKVTINIVMMTKKQVEEYYKKKNKRQRSTPATFRENIVKKIPLGSLYINKNTEEQP